MEKPTTIHFRVYVNYNGYQKCGGKKPLHQCNTTIIKVFAISKARIFFFKFLKHQGGMNWNRLCKKLLLTLYDQVCLGGLISHDTRIFPGILQAAVLYDKLLVEAVSNSLRGQSEIQILNDTLRRIGQIRLFQKILRISNVLSILCVRVYI